MLDSQFSPVPRKIHTDPNQVPTNVKVLGVRVRVPRILFATYEGTLHDLTLHDTQVVYVEISDEEYERLRKDQNAVNAFVESLGPEIAQALGGYVKGWHA